MGESESTNPLTGIELGLGTAAWGDKLMWDYGRSHTDADLEVAFEASLAGGIHLIDTAEVYGRGRSERLLGRFIAASEPRLTIVSKFFPYPWRLRRSSLLKALRQSLNRLGRTEVDLYLLHWPFPPVPIETWMDALADVVEAGLACSVGVSNLNLEQMRRAHTALAQRGIPLTANQVEYNLLQRKPERTGLQIACQDLGVRLMAYSPLAQGALTGKYSPDKPLPGFRGRRFNKRLEEIQSLVDLMREIGEAHGGRTPAQVALNWVITKGALPIPGAKNAHQAEQNAGATGWRLTEDEVAALDRASDEVGQAR